MKQNDMVLGIDIGGTESSFGFVDRQGTLLATAAIPTLADDPVDVFIARLKSQTDHLGQTLQGQYRLAGIGIGAPNAHHGRGTIERPVNLNWGDIVPFTTLIRAHYGVPVFITNDANAAALGEMMFGHARTMKHFIVVTLGTGLGSGIVVDGRLLYGASGFAGELGHTIVDPAGRACHCGKQGCLETYVSASGIVRTTLELLASHKESSRLRSVKIQEITSRILFEFASNGDRIALTAFDRTARILGMKMADAVAHVSPEAIFLTGGLAAAGDLLLQPAQRYLNEFLFPVYRGSVSLILSGLPAGTGAILGAAALIWNELEM